MQSDQLASLLLVQTAQVSALACCVWILARTLAKDRPHLAHAMWALVLLKCMTPPLVASPTSPFSWLARATTSDSDIDRSVPSPVAATVESLPSAEAMADDASSDLGTWISTHRWKQPQRDAWEETTGGVWRFDSSDVDSQSDDASAVFPLAGLTIACWFAGAVGWACVTLVRLCVFLRRVGRSATEPNPQLERLTERLTKQLGIRRRVAVTVVDRVIGPAVIGVCRPRILLPQLIIENKSDAELEPLIAHELVHIRRGDLLWATLQTLAVASAWFNPLVWLASRMMNRETERSCDEETIASLGCSPSAYARSLLDVLERKHQLQIAPALPGVRPVEITANRMERIMRLGQGSCRRCPLWVTVVAVVGCLVVLPGGAWVTAQDQSVDERTTPKAEPPLLPPLKTGILPSPPLRPANAIGPLGEIAIAKEEVPSVTPVDVATRFTLATFEVGECVDAMQKELKVDADTVAPAFTSLIPRCEHWKDAVPTTPHGVELSFAIDGHGIQQLGNTEEPIKLIGNKLYVFSTPDHHQIVREQIERMRKYGFSQVCVSAAVVSVPVALMQQLDIDWVIEQPAASDVKPVAYLEFEADGVVRTSLTGVLDDEQFQSFRDDMQGDPNVNLLSAPRVMVWNGRDASIFTGSQRPYVVSVKPQGKSHAVLEPVIQVVHEGTSIGVQPIYDPAMGKFELHCRLQVNEIESVDTFTFRRPGGKAGDLVTVQLPQVKTQRMETAVKLDVNHSVVIGGIQQTINGEKMATLVCLTPSLIDQEDLSSSETAWKGKRRQQQAETWRKIAAAPETATAYEDLLEVVVTCEGPNRSSVELESLIDKLRSADIAASIEGNLRYTIEDGLVSMQGEQLSIRADENALAVACDNGQLRYRPESGEVKAVLDGHAKISVSETASYEADRITFDSVSGKLTLTGNVTATVDGTSIECEQLTHDTTNDALEIAEGARIKRIRIKPGKP